MARITSDYFGLVRIGGETGHPVVPAGDWASAACGLASARLRRGKEVAGVGLHERFSFQDSIAALTMYGVTKPVTRLN